MAKRKNGDPSSTEDRTKASVISFRAGDDLAARLDAHADRLRGAQPGSSWSRSSAALNLVLRALDQAEAPE